MPATQVRAACNSVGNNQTCTNPAGTTVSGGVFGIEDNSTLNLTNFGSVTGTDSGVYTFNANIFNSGRITGDDTAGVNASGTTNVVNTAAGFISGRQFGVYSDLNANVTNSGTISSSNVGIVGFSDVTVKNSGSIMGASGGVLAFGGATVVNSGTIVGDSAIESFGPLHVTNSGVIQGGGVGIQGGNGSGSTLVNSGAITSGTTAISLYASSHDILTFLPGTFIVGYIVLGSNETVNIVTGNQRSMTLYFGGFGFGGPARNISDTGSTLNVSGGAPYVFIPSSGVPGSGSLDQFSAIDPTALSLADKNLMSFTGSISAMLGNRFGEFGSAGTTPSAFAAPAVNGLVDGANAVFGNALAYAGDSRMPNATAYDKASGVSVWSRGFAGIYRQGLDGPNLGSRTQAFGGMIGLDRMVTPDLRLGAFFGGGNSRLQVDEDSQNVKTDYVFGGGYGRFDWGTRFLDFAITGGQTSSRSQRTALNNLVAGGIETGTASYNGWFVTPELAYGLRIPLAGNIVMTPAARLRYLAAYFGGYDETGTSQGLSVAGRTAQNLEERLEVAFSRISPLGTGVLKATATVGVLGQERIGNTAINTILAGQNLSFAATGRNNVAGVFTNLGFDYRLSRSVSVFGSAEFTAMSDDRKTAIAQGGLRVTLD